MQCYQSKEPWNIVQADFQCCFVKSYKAWTNDRKTAVIQSRTDREAPLSTRKTEKRHSWQNKLSVTLDKTTEASLSTKKTEKRHSWQNYKSITFYKKDRSVTQSQSDRTSRKAKACQIAIAKTSRSGAASTSWTSSTSKAEFC